MSVHTIQTTQLERENLEAHVDLCAERYRSLEQQVGKIDTRLTNIEKSVTQMREDSIREFSLMRESMARSQHTTNKILLGTAGTVIAGILTVIVTLLMT